MTPSTDYRAPLDKAVAHALAYLDGLEAAPVGPRTPLETLRGRLDRPLGAHGTPAGRVIDELVADVEGGLVGSGGGRFFAWVVGGALPAALAADWLVSAWDQNASIYDASPAEAVLEETVGRWLKEVLRLPATASFALTTGCQMAHVTCLAAARHAVLARLGWDVEARGLAGAPPIRVLSSQRHGSVDRALRFLGLGTDSITQLDLEGAGPARRDVLETALHAFRGQPVILLLAAGEINTGSFDTFTDRVIAGIVRSGVAYFAGTTWQGRRCMRVSVCNWRTDAADVAETLAAVQGALELAGSPSR